jgi:serine/threonine protein kinase
MTDLADVYRIDNFNDTFALGHYARVMDAVDLRSGQSVAFKVLRPEHLASVEGDIRWEYRAFANEADLLLRLDASPHVVRLLDCGYVSALGEAPLGGQIEAYGREVAVFSRVLRKYAERGWRPYLALENLPRAYNLFYLMRPDRAGMRMRLPTEEGLALALQFGETLRLAHRMGIVYLDHKLEHVYWDGVHLRIIDLNSSRQLDLNDRQTSRFLQMDIHNLCVGILYSIFTGLSPQKTTLRPQPGTFADVETRYQDVTSLDFGVEPTLSDALQTLLQRGAAVQIASIDEFIDGLQEVATINGWDFPNRYTSPASRDARGHIRAGLTRLRQGEDLIREARDLFREAAIQDGISQDIEAELRRLVKVVNEMLNYRPIP